VRYIDANIVAFDDTSEAKGEICLNLKDAKIFRYGEDDRDRVETRPSALPP